MTERPIDTEPTPGAASVTPPVAPADPDIAPAVSPAALPAVSPGAAVPTTTSSVVPPPSPPSAVPPVPAAVVADDVAEVTAEDRIREGAARSEDEQRADLAEVREELGDTVEELVRRVDVPARVKAKREETVANVRSTVAQAKVEAETRVPAVRPLLERPAIPAAVAGALLVVLLIVRRVRRRSSST